MKKITLIFTFLFLCIICNAQTILNCQKVASTCGTSWDPGPMHTYGFNIRNASFNDCGGNPSIGSNFSDCMIKWTLTNGVFFGTNTSTKQGIGLTDVNDVQWNNVSGSGTIKYEILSSGSTCAKCTTAATSAEITKPINYLAPIGNLSFSSSTTSGTTASSFSLPCGTQPLTLSVPSVTGASYYNWILPSGWTKSGSGNSITATPTQNSGGAITVVVGRTDTGMELQRIFDVTRPSPSSYGSINGSSIICNSGTGSSQAYTVSDLPGGATISHWSSSSNISINSSTGVAIAPSPNKSAGKIYAHISHPCGNQVIEKDVWLGVPIITIFGDENLCMGIITTYQAVNEIDLSNSEFTCSWSTSSSYLWHSDGNSNIESVSTSMPGVYYLTNISYNICGASMPGSLGIVVSAEGCGPGGSLSSNSSEELIVYPNPATATVSVMFDESNDEDVNYSIISEINSKLVINGVVNKVNKEIDISQLPRGKYYIHIKLNNELIKRILEIK